MSSVHSVHRVNLYENAHGGGQSQPSVDDTGHKAVKSTTEMSERMLSIFSSLFLDDGTLEANACESLGKEATKIMKATNVWRDSEAYFHETSSPSLTIEVTPQFKDCFHFLCPHSNHLYIIVGEEEKSEMISRGYIPLATTHINRGGILPTPVLSHRSSRDSQRESGIDHTPMNCSRDSTSDSTWPVEPTGTSTSQSQHGDSEPLVYIPNCPKKDVLGHIKQCFEIGIPIEFGPNVGGVAIPFRKWTPSMETQNSQKKNRLMRYAQIYIYIVLDSSSSLSCNKNFTHIYEEAMRWIGRSSEVIKNLPGISYFKKACQLASRLTSGQ